MDDRDIVERISGLVAEEHRLQNGHVGNGLSEAEHAQLHEVEVQLDQCWDLLAQRRARRSAGLDPDGASMRGEDVVERFEQ